MKKIYNKIINIQMMTFYLKYKKKFLKRESLFKKWIHVNAIQKILIMLSKLNNMLPQKFCNLKENRTSI